MHAPRPPYISATEPTRAITCNVDVYLSPLATSNLGPGAPKDKVVAAWLIGIVPILRSRHLIKRPRILLIIIHAAYGNAILSLAGLRSGDGPLSVRVRPSSLKHDCDRRTTNTAGNCPVNVHMKSRLTPEPLRTLGW